MKIIDKIQMIIKKSFSTSKKAISSFNERPKYEKTIIFYTIAAAAFIIYGITKK